MDEEKSRVLAGLFGGGDDGAHALTMAHDVAIDDIVVGVAGIARLFHEGAREGERFAVAKDFESQRCAGLGFAYCAGDEFGSDRLALKFEDEVVFFEADLFGGEARYRGSGDEGFAAFDAGRHGLVGWWGKAESERAAAREIGREVLYEVVADEGEVGEGRGLIEKSEGQERGNHNVTNCNTFL